MVVTWNSIFRKLTTSDQYGLIIVWMLHKGMWFEEMINNRNKSVVRDMKWTADGQKICIIYEDGAVIVGSVDGNRLWGKEVGTTLAFVEWSPDGRDIVFVTPEGQVNLFDNRGNKISGIKLYAVEDSPAAVRSWSLGAWEAVAHSLALALAIGLQVPVVGINWYDGMQGRVDPNAPALAIAFENGHVQVMRSVTDDNPVLIATGMSLRQCKWNRNGTVLALAGSQLTTLSSGDQREVSLVQFYNPWGQHLRTLKVPGSGIQELSWEGGGLRIAVRGLLHCVMNLR